MNPVKGCQERKDYIQTGGSEKALSGNRLRGMKVLTSRNSSSREEIIKKNEAIN